MFWSCAVVAGLLGLHTSLIYCLASIACYVALPCTAKRGTEDAGCKLLPSAGCCATTFRERLLCPKRLLLAYAHWLALRWRTALTPRRTGHQAGAFLSAAHMPQVCWHASLELDCKDCTCPQRTAVLFAGRRVCNNIAWCGCCVDAIGGGGARVSWPVCWAHARLLSDSAPARAAVVPSRPLCWWRCWYLCAGMRDALCASVAHTSHEPQLSIPPHASWLWPTTWSEHAW